MAAAYDGHASKRQRTDDDGHGVQSGNRDHFDDPHKPQPSAVVHVRGLTEHVMEPDLVDAVQRYGAISIVMMMPRKRQALVEFEDIQGAKNCVECTHNSPVHIRGAMVYFNYSTSKKIQRPNIEEHPNSILLFTIINPQYPITVDVMHTICSTSGQVLRVVIFKKNGVQAMVEFDSVETARRAKQNLNGADIYSGCCTLKIEYAKPTRLNVIRNDQESWDYTNPGLGASKEQPQSKSTPLLADPRYTAGPTPYAPSDPRNHHAPNSRSGPPSYQSEYSMPDSGGYGGDPYARSDRYTQPPGWSMNDESKMDRGGRYEPHTSSMDPYGGPPRHGGGGGGPYAGESSSAGGPPGMVQQGCVLMVYGLNMDKINAARIFNLFCLYGNVVRVKFLKTKEGSAMVQLGDGPSCDRAMKNLNGVYLFGSKLQLGFSKQAFLQDVPNPHNLGDGTPSFQDFMGNRNNRFTTPEAAQKNRIQPPSRILHYFNAPPLIQDEDIVTVFEELGVNPPPKMKKFPSKTDRSSTGLLEWESKAEATEALTIGNHAQIPNPTGKHPFVFKLCFSSSPIVGVGE